MTKEEIKQFILTGETISVEFKKCRHELSDAVFETVCAFLNRIGGHILLGIDDNREIIGVNERSIEGMLKNFANIVNNPQQLNPTAYFSSEIINLDGKKVISIYIPESSQVHHYRNRIYDRIGDADNDITLNHALIDNLYLRKRKDFTENEVCPFLTMDDLSSSTFEKARNLVSLSNTSHLWLTMSNEEILRSAGFWRRDSVTGKEGYILACALLFGTEVTVLTYCPAYRTDAIYQNMSYQHYLNPRSSDPDIRYADRDDIRVNLIEAYIRLMSFVQKHLPDRFMMDEASIQRIDIRSKIFREIVANLLAHREYSSSYPAKLLISSDLLITENWSKPQQTGVVTLDNLETHPKNPMIAKIFKELGWVEELGSGRKNIQRYAPLYYPDYKVEIQNQEKFVFSISYNKSVSDLVPQHELQKELQKEYEYDIEAIGKEIGTKLALSWDQVGTKLGPSWDQVGTKSALSWPQVEKLLSTLKSPLAIKELMGLLDWKNRTKFRDKYINPLIETGIINMTNPDKPQSSNQQYYLSKKGSVLLRALKNGNL
ncbi:MAG: putative DNA binding domain-containing protein [Bacteroidetes bacterium]|nr:putative DNA binding domain-containing protein [Bacteroidota bacterium]